MHSRKKPRRHVSKTLVLPLLGTGALIIIFGLIVWLSPQLSKGARIYFEKMDLLLADHSAIAAYAYGDEHFSVTDPQAYDINAARYFYQVAAERDPTLLYVDHQLARIEFLNGDFQGAFAYIDMQILAHGDSTPASYYVRGLIEGYRGEYADAERDYARFITLKPDTWAGMNDYAWVLLKDNKPEEAAAITSKGLKLYPDNAWLLNTNATALYEMGDIKDARAIVTRASTAVQALTQQQWSQAFPGNSPDVAQAGLDTFRKAVADNMHTMLVATTSISR